MLHLTAVICSLVRNAPFGPPFLPPGSHQVGRDSENAGCQQQQTPHVHVWGEYQHVSGAGTADGSRGEHVVSTLVPPQGTRCRRCVAAGQWRVRCPRPRIMSWMQRGGTVPGQQMASGRGPRPASCRCRGAAPCSLPGRLAVWPPGCLAGHLAASRTAACRCVQGNPAPGAYVDGGATPVGFGHARIKQWTVPPGILWGGLVCWFAAADCG
jgi:hypothetical protein